MRLDKEELKEIHKEVRSPDKFVQTSKTAINYLTKHQTLLISILVLIGVGTLSYLGWTLYKTQMETKAQTALYQARKEMYPQLARPNAQPNQAEAPRVFNDKVAQSFQSVVENYPRSQAALLASIELSQSYLDQGNREAALNILKKAQGHADGKEILSHLFHFQQAKVLQAANNCQEAIGILDSIYGNKNIMGSVRAEALLKKASCQNTLQQEAQAYETYQKVTQEFPESSSANMARQFMQLVKRPQS